MQRSNNAKNKTRNNEKNNMQTPIHAEDMLSYSVNVLLKERRKVFLQPLKIHKIVGSSAEINRIRLVNKHKNKTYFSMDGSALSIVENTTGKIYAISAGLLGSKISNKDMLVMDSYLLKYVAFPFYSTNNPRESIEKLYEHIPPEEKNAIKRLLEEMSEELSNTPDNTSFAVMELLEAIMLEKAVERAKQGDYVIVDGSLLVPDFGWNKLIMNKKYEAVKKAIRKQVNVIGAVKDTNVKIMDYNISSLLYWTLPTATYVIFDEEQIELVVDGKKKDYHDPHKYKLNTRDFQIVNTYTKMIDVTGSKPVRIEIAMNNKATKEEIHEHTHRVMKDLVAVSNTIYPLPMPTIAIHKLLESKNTEYKEVRKKITAYSSLFKNDVATYLDDGRKTNKTHTRLDMLGKQKTIPVNQ